MDLAEQVIKANEEEAKAAEEAEIVQKREDDGAPEGYYTDELGYWVEQDIRRNKLRFARYVYTRCRRLNPKLHVRRELFLYNSDILITEKSLDICRLAHLAEPIHMAQAAWVYRRLFDTVPRLDESKMEIAPGVLWNYKTQELEEREKGTYLVI